MTACPENHPRVRHFGSAWHVSCIPEAVVEIAVEAWAETGRHSRWPVQGLSMWPLLQPDDVVEVAHDRRGSEPGDLLVYRVGARAVVHRLLRRTGDLWLLGSDHLPTADALVPVEAVIGRVIAIQTPGGRLDVTSHPARRLGRLIAACHPWRSHWGLRRLVKLLAHLQRRSLRP